MLYKLFIFSFCDSGDKLTLHQIFRDVLGIRTFITLRMTFLNIHLVLPINLINCWCSSLLLSMFIQREGLINLVYLCFLKKCLGLLCKYAKILNICSLRLNKKGRTAFIVWQECKRPVGCAWHRGKEHVDWNNMQNNWKVEVRITTVY